ncbi:MAG: hypothetical protein HYX32_04235 [Actinobacteria bacterium]|nr:hypothetical protein [Actinomycetota bacterium]
MWSRWWRSRCGTSIGLLQSHLDARGDGDAGEAITAADYERRDTVTSLTMGVGSLLAPLLVPKVLGPVTPGKGRFGRALLVTGGVPPCRARRGVRTLRRNRRQSEWTGQGRGGGGGSGLRRPWR